MRCWLIIFVIAFSFSCKKDVKYVYQVQEVHVETPGADKPNVKKSTEYISIAYSDIFGKSIPSELLDDLTRGYASFGDITVIEELIVRNFLNESKAIVPSESEMRKDIGAFVKVCYNQFYSREPDGQELWFWENKIKENTGLTPEAIYFAFLTSNEYRQF